MFRLILLTTILSLFFMNHFTFAKEEAMPTDEEVGDEERGDARRLSVDPWVVDAQVTSDFDENLDIVGMNRYCDILLWSKDVRLFVGGHANGPGMPPPHDSSKLIAAAGRYIFAKASPMVITPKGGEAVNFDYILGGCDGSRQAPWDGNNWALDIYCYYDGSVYNSRNTPRRFRLRPNAVFLETVSPEGGEFRDPDIKYDLLLAPLANYDSTIAGVVTVRNDSDTPYEDVRLALTTRAHLQRDEQVFEPVRRYDFLEQGRFADGVIEVKGYHKEAGNYVPLLLFSGVKQDGSNADRFDICAVGEEPMPSFAHLSDYFDFADGQLSNFTHRGPSGRDLMLALQFNLGSLQPGEKKRMGFLLVAETKGQHHQARRKLKELLSVEWLAREIEATADYWDTWSPEEGLYVRTPDKYINGALKWGLHAVRSCTLPTGIPSTGGFGFLSFLVTPQDPHFGVPAQLLDHHPFSRSVDKYVQLIGEEGLVGVGSGMEGFFVQLTTPLEQQRGEWFLPERLIPTLYRYWVWTGDDERMARHYETANRLVEKFVYQAHGGAWEYLLQSRGTETVGRAVRAPEVPYAMLRLADMAEYLNQFAEAEHHRSEGLRVKTAYNTAAPEGFYLTEGDASSPGGVFARYRKGEPGGPDGLMWNSEAIILGSATPEHVRSIAARIADTAAPHWVDGQGTRKNWKDWRGSGAEVWYWHNALDAAALGHAAEYEPQWADRAAELLRWQGRAMVGGNDVGSPGESTNGAADSMLVGGMIVYYGLDAFLRFDARRGGLKFDPILPSSWASIDVHNLRFQKVEYDIHIARKGGYRVGELRINGEDWASKVLPNERSGRVEVWLRPQLAHPVLSGIGPRTRSVRLAHWDARAETLTVELEGVVDSSRTETLTVETGPSWRLTEVSDAAEWERQSENEFVVRFTYDKLLKKIMLRFRHV